MYRYALGGIVLLYALVIAMPAWLLGLANVAILGGLVVLLVNSRRYGRRWSAWVAAAVGAMLVGSGLAAVAGSEAARDVTTSASTAVLVGATIALIGSSVVRSPEVDGAVMMMVLSVYLLLALLFAAIHNLGVTFQPHYLRGVGEPPTPSDTLYFSVVTLTSIGFGDIVPGGNLARAVTVVEALVGQLFLVSVVAVSVSRFRPRRQSR
ncbi:potassium channel family protein [Pilimelia columellifera]|uniref:Potassium channel domain-containing protein n=1 Tax=Pilimelia columellifera subsp. columellifera TaxID=706583 RepID=A0ABP6AIF5_9ACTN